MDIAGMLYSEQHRFLFVHISKTGGSNMERALRPYSHQPPFSKLDRLLSKIRCHWDYRRHRFQQHDSMALAARVLPAGVFQKCFKFGLVRNPWDWLVSLYFFLKRKESHRHHSLVAKMTFAEYVDFEIRRDYRHQHRLCMDRRHRMLVDYLGRFEEIESALDLVCARLQIPRPPLERIGVRKRDKYTTLYDDALIEKVRRHWWLDISAFGYEFEGYEPGDIVENYRRRTPGVSG